MSNDAKRVGVILPPEYLKAIDKLEADQPERGRYSNFMADLVYRTLKRRGFDVPEPRQPGRQKSE